MSNEIISDIYYIRFEIKKQLIFDAQNGLIQYLSYSHIQQLAKQYKLILNISIETLLTLPANIQLINPQNLQIKYVCLPFYSKINYEKKTIQFKYNSKFVILPIQEVIDKLLKWKDQGVIICAPNTIYNECQQNITKQDFSIEFDIFSQYFDYFSVSKQFQLEYLQLKQYNKGIYLISDTLYEQSKQIGIQNVIINTHERNPLQTNYDDNVLIFTNYNDYLTRNFIAYRPDTLLFMSNISNKNQIQKMTDFCDQECCQLSKSYIYHLYNTNESVLSVYLQLHNISALLKCSKEDL